MNTRLRMERRKRRWTQNEVANKIGITKGALHNLETGQRRPSYDVLVKLENLFHLSHRQLFAVVDGENESLSKE